MTLPHDIRFLVHDFFIRALRKWGLADQMLKTATASAKLQVLINSALLGNRSKEDEMKLIEAIAEMEVYMHQVIRSLGAESSAKLAIQSKLEQLNSEALKK